MGLLNIANLNNKKGRTIMSVSNYIGHVQGREIYDKGMSSEYEIARGINVTNNPAPDRNLHLWCYSDEAIDAVEQWLIGLNVIKNPNFKAFANFEELYNFVEREIIGIKGVGAVMVYDVSLCLGERMMPQVVPQDYVYVHGKLIAAARHIFSMMNLPVTLDRNVHRIRTSLFNGMPTYNTTPYVYTARAIEEWLCQESKNIMKATSISTLP